MVVDNIPFVKAKIKSSLYSMWLCLRWALSLLKTFLCNPKRDLLVLVKC